MILTNLSCIHYRMIPYGAYLLGSTIHLFVRLNKRA
jgi:hypothetical protein